MNSRHSWVLLTAVWLGIGLLAVPSARAQESPDSVSVRIIKPGPRGVRFLPPRPGSRPVIIVRRNGSTPRGEGAGEAKPGEASAAGSPELDRLVSRIAALERDLSDAVAKLDRQVGRLGPVSVAGIQSLPDSVAAEPAADEVPGPSEADAVVVAVPAVPEAPEPYGPPPVAAAGDTLKATAEAPPGQVQAVRAELIDRWLLEGGLFRTASIVFHVNSASLESHAYTALDTIAAVLGRHPDVRVAVVGHTDISGDPVLNLQLSRERAETVASYLVEAGVDPNRVRAEGRGASEPIADNSTRFGRILNRRVEFLVER